MSRPRIDDDVLADIDDYLDGILRVPVESVGLDTKLRIVLEEAQKGDSGGDRPLDDVAKGLSGTVRDGTVRSNRQT